MLIVCLYVEFANFYCLETMFAVQYFPLFNLYGLRMLVV